MKHSLLCYLKCCLANRFTAAGYLLLIISSSLFQLFLVTGILSHQTFIRLVLFLVLSFFAGIMLLVMTGFGLGTLHTYNETVSRIKAGAKKNAILNYRPEMYCNRVGHHLAISEHFTKKQKEV